MCTEGRKMPCRVTIYRTVLEAVFLLAGLIGMLGRVVKEILHGFGEDASHVYFPPGRAMWRAKKVSKDVPFHYMGSEKLQLWPTGEREFQRSHIATSNSADARRSLISNAAAGSFKLFRQIGSPIT